MTEEYPNKIYGFIQRLEADRIIGWVGSANASSSVELKLNLSDIELGIVNVDMRKCTHSEIRKGIDGCWFECHFDPMVLLDRYNIHKEIVLSMEGNGIHIGKEKTNYSFVMEEWLDNYIHILFTQEHFLHFFTLFGSSIETKLTVCELCQALLWMEMYGLYRTQVEKKEIILNALLVKIAENNDDNRCFSDLLLQNDDLLAYFMNRVQTLKDPTMVRILKDVLLNLSPGTVKDLLSKNSDLFFEIQQKVDKALEKEAEWYQLLTHPDEILQRWEHFSPEDRIVYTLPFLSLFHQLQAYDKIADLGVTLDEWSKVCDLDSVSNPVDVCQTLFAFGRDEEALLVTLYFISLGCSDKSLLSYIEILMAEDTLFILDDMSVWEWIFLDKLFVSETISLEEQKAVINLFAKHIEKKSLWPIDSVRSIYEVYINQLLAAGDETFLKTYELCMQHYLLDNRFILDLKICTEKYLEKEQCSWVKSVEEIRQKAIPCLGRVGQEKRLLGYLDMISYLSPELVRKVKYSICRNSINLDQRKEVLENTSFSLLNIGGRYDKLIASQYLQNTELYAHHEASLISGTKKWRSQSSNNYWYHQALLVRNSTEKTRLLFLTELFTYLQRESIASPLQLRLIRLLISEIIWNLEKGVVPETLTINGLSIENIMQECMDLNALSLKYTEMFAFYKELSHVSVDTEGLCFLDLVKSDDSFTYSYSMIQRLQKVLKLESSSKLNIEEAKAHMRETMLYPYTLILIYSCQAYRDTRQQTIRDTWLLRAKEFGIAYKFVVGDSDVSKTEGDMIYLDVKDSYEYLPQKTVEMFRFVSTQFSFDHFMKIDDDCFVNIDAFFSDDLLFDTNYYGRYVHRSIGDTDRVWHQKKSQTEEAKQAIDLSPEPSYYADGSTGYVLSHYACKALCDAYELKKNDMLVKHSYLEDKLVGDLLAQQNVKLESGNFTSVVYRKVTKEREASFWEYNLFPRSNNEMKVLHCETEERLNHVWKHFFDTGIKKAQPEFFSDQPIDNLLGAYDKQAFLEEVYIRKNALNTAKYVAVFIAKDESAEFSDFLAYHRKLGIEHFIYIDNASKDNSIALMEKEEDVSILITTQICENFHSGLDWLKTVYTHFCYGKWVLTLNMNERFMVAGNTDKSLSELATAAEKNGYDAFPSVSVETSDISSFDLSTVSTKGMFIFKESIDEILSDIPIRKSLHIQKKVQYSFFKYKPNQIMTEKLSFMDNIHPSITKTLVLHLTNDPGR